MRLKSKQVVALVWMFVIVQSDSELAVDLSSFVLLIAILVG